MFLPSLMLIAALDRPSIPELPTSFASAPVTITPDNVELNGAGAFSFDPDEGAFSVDAPRGDNGVSFVERLWFNAAGQPVACDVAKTALAAAARTGCAQLMRSARFKIFPGIDIQYRRGFIDVEFSFYKKAARTQLFVMPMPGYANIIVNYPPERTTELVSIDPAGAKLIFTIGPGDYPPIAMRYSLESANTMVLGVGRDGAIKTCRPIGTSELRTSFLDNYTCVRILRRAHVQFSENFERFVGIRYLKQRIRWKMPS